MIRTYDSAGWCLTHTSADRWCMCRLPDGTFVIRQTPYVSANGWHMCWVTRARCIKCLRPIDLWEMDRQNLSQSVITITITNYRKHITCASLCHSDRHFGKIYMGSNLFVRWNIDVQASTHTYRLAYYCPVSPCPLITPHYATLHYNISSVVIATSLQWLSYSCFVTATLLQLLCYSCFVIAAL